MAETDSDNISRQRKIEAILATARYNPAFLLPLIVLGIAVALLEGVGITFIVPVIETVRTANPAANAEGITAIFASIYETLGVPFTLGSVVVGVAGIMTLRYTGSFVYNWLRKMLRFSYQRHLQKRAVSGALGAQMEYFDQEGSDDILNIIITESSVSAETIDKMSDMMNLIFLTSVYLLIALWVSPLLTVLSIGVLGGLTLVLRVLVSPGYELGELVADGNEKRQEAAQAGMMGIRDIRVFDLQNEIYRNFVDAVDQFTHYKVKAVRNEVAISEFYKLSVAVFVFVLIYLGLRVANLSFSELGLFLFLMFQLGPKVSNLNQRLYSLENMLPHLVRTQNFLNELDEREEPDGDGRPVPETVSHVEFDGVEFSYEEDETVLRGVDFSVRSGEFVAFVGQSGAGKSTIVSLLARYYEPDGGHIYVNDAPLDEMDPQRWRKKTAIVRQSPYIFDDTLRYNLTVGNREASQDELDRACEIAKVNEFFDMLPNGYESELGDAGVRLSGGQKQRVALARALLKDADLLILDEATSDLDSNLEKQVQRAIEEMDQDYAIITIAHRLSTVENADRIYTMEDGRVSERGTHDDLIDSGGKYADLYSIQSK